MFGEVLNVPGILIMIAIVVFGRIMGVVGIFLAIPISAIIVYLLDEYAFPRLEVHKKKKDVQKAAKQKEEGEA